MVKEMRSHSPGAPGDIVWALDRLVRLVAPQDLNPQARTYHRRVSDWLKQITPESEGADQTSAAKLAAGFPLTRAQLRELQVDTQRVVSQHAAKRSRGSHARRRKRGTSIASPFLFPFEHLHERWHPTRLSSWAIAGGLVVLAALNVVELLVPTNLPLPALFGINLAAITVVMGIWALHHFHFLSRSWHSVQMLFGLHLHHLG